MEFSSDDKLKGFLKSESKRLGISIKNAYSTYFSRILLEKINEKCLTNIYVKGSFSELAHLGKMIRPITDLDLVSTEYKSDSLDTLFAAIYSEDDDLTFDLKRLPRQTKTGIYKMNIIATFGKIQQPLSIDFQELSKTIYEKEYKRIDPIFKGDKHFYIYTPSYEEHFAEKLCIVTESNKPDVLNTRVKDFYDIYKLYGGKYDEEKLLYFFYHMLKDRNKINVEDANVDFIDNNFIEKHAPVWDNVSEKLEFMDKSISFKDAVVLTRDLLRKYIENLDKAKELKITLR